MKTARRFKRGLNLRVSTYRRNFRGSALLEGGCGGISENRFVTAIDRFLSEMVHGQKMIPSDHRHAPQVGKVLCMQSLRFSSRSPQPMQTVQPGKSNSRTSARKLR